MTSEESQGQTVNNVNNAPTQTQDPEADLIGLQFEVEVSPNHPLFLHASDTPGAQLVSQPLIGAENYGIWSRTMRNALLSKNKLGFIDGTWKKTLFQYIKAAPGQGLLLNSSTSLTIDAYCDSDWASCPITRRSVTGYLVKLGGSLISWKCKKQQTVSRSSAEAEFRSMAHAVAELVWITGLLKELGVIVQLPVNLFCDNKAALQIAANPIFHERTKHVEIDCYFIREKLLQGLIRTQHVSSQAQLANLLTKALTSQQHHQLLSKLGMFNLYHPPA